MSVFMLPKPQLELIPEQPGKAVTLLPCGKLTVVSQTECCLLPQGCFDTKIDKCNVLGQRCTRNIECVTDNNTARTDKGGIDKVNVAI